MNYQKELGKVQFSLVDHSSVLKYEMIDLVLHFRLREIPEEARSFRLWLRILLTIECFLDLAWDFSTL